MKMRLLTGLIAAAFFSQAASAARLSSGSLTNQTTATADVEFSQPITLQNTLTPIAGLKAGQVVGNGNNLLQIANGSLEIKDSGVTALLALRVSPSEISQPIAYAAGHEGDDKYAITYVPLPKDASLADIGSKYNQFSNTSGTYAVTPAASSKLDYGVFVIDTRGTGIKPGTYTINTEGAIYNP